MNNFVVNAELFIKFINVRNSTYVSISINLYKAKL